LKNCLAFFGLLSLIILAGVGLLLGLPYLDPDFSIPDYFLPVETPLINPGPAQVGASLPAVAIPPTPIPTQPPVPTPTPIPDPAEYRARVLIRLRHFATALEAFYDNNEKLRDNPALFEDPNWRSETRATLDELETAALDLSGVHSIPAEYALIQAELEQIGPQTRDLKYHYLAGLETSSQSSFQAAGDSLANIVTVISQVEIRMLEAGWSP
jgi:hypothetical protein